MALRAETRADLRAELERIEQRAEALRAILEEEAPAQKAAGKHAAARNGGGNANGIRRTGLREEIRRVVREKPGLTATDLAKRIASAGWQDDPPATTPLAIRVGNEARRMSRGDHPQLKKKGRKYYSAENAHEERG